MASSLPSEVPIRPGEVLAGKYRLEGVLGEGGMGVVFVGLHVSLDERVAIKVLHPKRASDPQIVTRFVREAKTGFKLRSEHAVRTLDVDVHPTPSGDLPYIVMELLEGQDLSHRIDGSGAIPVLEAVDLVLQACEALASAHALGIVHRDLKPSNLFLTEGPDGKVFLKVLDFGISKMSEIGDAVGGVTTTDAVLGSPGYMPPEQMRASRNVDARADIWSLAMVLWEMLVGKPMFATETFPEMCAKVLHGDLPTARAAGAAIPEGLEAVITRALASEPEARHPTVLAFAEALAPFLGEDARARLLRIGNLSKPPAARGSSNPPLAPPLSVASTATSHPPPALKRTTTPIPWGVTESGATDGQQREPKRGRIIWVGAAALLLGSAVTIAALGRTHHPTVTAASSGTPTTPVEQVEPSASAPAIPVSAASTSPAASMAPPSAAAAPKDTVHGRPHASASGAAPTPSTSSWTVPPNGAPILR